MDRRKFLQLSTFVGAASMAPSLLLEALAPVEAAPGTPASTGGMCAPVAPMYDFFRLAEPSRPIADSLPVVSAQRGGIEFLAGNGLTMFAEDFTGLVRLDSV